MTAVIAICVAVVFAVSIYMMLGRELMGLAIGVFLIGHAANLSILAMSGSPVLQHTSMSATPEFKAPPILESYEDSKRWAAAQPLTLAESHAMTEEQPLDVMVDPLPQALILTAIVIGFAVMGFLLTLIVLTQRRTKTLHVDDLAKMNLPTPSKAH
ncbi:Na(+)/H(+) antiporter subunit C [Poriferisphaera corsica]|uniref:Na(+)/H(+) antiporter subunit C n=1 Tax=Poriferisphaera corsica TaxID=2528020 RepID=A0A517YUC3_9BACT|nr:sodium:proton antiporter [Poriferisphaera corsica]QDU33797.1 Na(+)/H(+) antiporter subunit C [Poriferisphaera corsica]